MSTVRHVTPEYLPTYLTVGDGDWFETQARELESTCPLTQRRPATSRDLPAAGGSSRTSISSAWTPSPGALC